MIETTIPAATGLRDHASQRKALDRAYTELYPDLCRIARARVRLSGQHELDPDSLVHECFLRLVGASAPPLSDAQHFCAYAAKTMQNIAIDVAREQAADRRGGRLETVSLEDNGAESLPEGVPQQSGAQQRIHDALLALEAAEPTLASLVRMRYFDGLSEQEIAARTGASRRTVRRHWERARELLHSLLQE